MNCRALALVVPALVLLAGCTATAPTAPAAPGGAGSAAAGSAPAATTKLSPAKVAADACSVLSAEEASAAWGGGITKAEGEGGTCNYIGLDHGILVTYLSGGNSMWDTMKYESGAAVSGIGDRAMTSDGAILFQRGTFVVDVTEAAGDDSTAANRESLAKAIAAKL